MNHGSAVEKTEAQGEVAQPFSAAACGVRTDDATVEVQTHSRESASQANRLRRLLEALPSGVIVLDRDGNVEQCNPAARAIVGCALTGQRWREVAQRIVTPRQDDDCDLSLHNGRRVNVTTCSLVDEPGQIVLLNDVTETRELQRKLADVRRLSEMGSMMAAIAHQIRTPLASALLHAGNAASQAGDSDLSKVVERLCHLDALVQDMLSFARQGSIEVEPVELSEILDQFRACVPIRQLAEFRVHDSVATPGLQVLCSAAALQSVFQNLVNNAAQASPGDRLRICVEAGLGSRSELEVVIRDNGPGVPGSLRDRIFEPFVSSRPQGTGLGLAVARRILESHGGHLKFIDNNDAGAAFLMSLPLVEGCRGEAIENSMAASAGQAGECA